MHVRKNLAIVRPMIGLCAAVAAAVFVSAASLQAATESFSNPIPASDDGGQYSLPTSASFTLPEFNPALGTLESVAIQFALQYQGEVDIYNISGSTQTFTNASSSVPISITAPSEVLPPLSASYFVSSGSLPSVFNSFPGPVLNTTIPLNPASADFGLYEGVGNNSYSLGYLAGTYSGTPGNSNGTIFFGGDANSVGTASVIYTYAPVPEPSSLVLMVLGAIGLGTMARRRIIARAH
jgi:PEP-CTERM motif